MKQIIRLSTYLTALFLVASGGTTVRTAQAETLITMKRSAEPRPGAAVLLSDLAVITGDDAEKLSKTVILPRPASDGQSVGGEIDVQQVRTALDSAGVNWAKVTLHGSRTRLLVSDDARPATDGHAAPAGSAPSLDGRSAGPLGGPVAGTVNGAVSLTPSGVPQSLYDTGNGPTLREIVGQRLAAMYEVAVDDLRAEYDNTPAVKYLDLPIGEVAEVTVLPQASTGTTRIPLRIELRRRDGIIDYRTLAARVELKRTVAVVSAPIDRGELITEDLIRVETRWISPAADAPLSRDRIIGASAKRRIDTGRLVTRGDVQPPIVVQRGETVKVRIISGTIQMEMRAKALSTARDGESVTLQSEGSKKTFIAKMEGRLAIADIGSSSQQDRPEAGAGAK